MTYSPYYKGYHGCYLGSKVYEPLDRRADNSTKMQYPQRDYARFPPQVKDSNSLWWMPQLNLHTSSVLFLKKFWRRLQTTKKPSWKIKLKKNSPFCTYQQSHRQDYKGKLERAVGSSPLKTTAESNSVNLEQASVWSRQEDESVNRPKNFLIMVDIPDKPPERSHEELEWLYCQYYSSRFQWLFSYWLFGLSKSFAKPLQKIYLRWQRFDKEKVSNWGSSDCDVQYLASLHYITSDFWNGKLANGDENIGIQSVENYFSMCRSLSAWILGRRWGKFKQKKVYKDALEGVYHMLKHELHVSMVDHNTFWVVAKVQMTRICSLAKVAGNYVNWKLIDVLPCYRMFTATGDFFYQEQIKNILFRKQLINNWLFQEENFWVVNLLPQSLLLLLEYDTKIYEESLHGDTLVAHLSRLIWLYLHTGQQLYIDAMKGFVYECAYSSYASQIYESASLAIVWT
ncbi:uncharacterized protein [Phyllobates terribilis]|uniref:uncharacterized protein n=1 Tax=Phyllobates terribilis TaxID=111132 RepID=UPI003CCB33E5